MELAGTDAAAQQGLLDVMATQAPLGRVAEPAEIARAVIFLASADASFVAGAELFADAAWPRCGVLGRCAGHPPRITPGAG